VLLEKHKKGRRKYVLFGFFHCLFYIKTEFQKKEMTNNAL